MYTSSTASRLRTTTARTAHRFTGQAYQLFSSKKLADGAYVEVNGPHDTFGQVTSSAVHADGRWLNQVRGIKPRVGETPVASL